MRKALLILATILSFGKCFGQPIINRTFGTNTVNDPRLMASLNLFIPRYADTTSANSSIGIDSAGAIIYTYNTNGLWARLSSPKRWSQLSSANAINIFNSNGVQTDALRIYNAAGGELAFTNGNSFNWTGNEIKFTTTNFDIAMVGLPLSDTTQYILGVNSAGLITKTLKSSIGGNQTLQQVFNTEIGGSLLTKKDTILTGMVNSNDDADTSVNFVSPNSGRTQITGGTIKLVNGRVSKSPSIDFYTDNKLKMGLGHDEATTHNYLDIRDSMDFNFERGADGGWMQLKYNGAHIYMGLRSTSRVVVTTSPVAAGDDGVHKFQVQGTSRFSDTSIFQTGINTKGIGINESVPNGTLRIYATANNTALVVHNALAGFKSIRVLDSANNAASSDASGFVAQNLAGHILQLYMGAVQNTHKPDAGMFRTSGNGGLFLVADGLSGEAPIYFSNSELNVISTNRYEIHKHDSLWLYNIVSSNNASDSMLVWNPTTKVVGKRPIPTGGGSSGNYYFGTAGSVGLQNVYSPNDSTARFISVADSSSTNGIGFVYSTADSVFRAYVKGIVAVANGGTAISLYTTGDLLYASGSGTLSKLGIGATGQKLTVVGGVPAWRDSIVPEVPLTFTNGLTRSSNTIRWGGALSNATTISSINSLIFVDNNNKAGLTIDTTGQAAKSGGTSKLQADLTNYFQVTGAGATSELTLFNTLGKSMFKVDSLAASAKRLNSILVLSDTITGSSTLGLMKWKSPSQFAGILQPFITTNTLDNNLVLSGTNLATNRVPQALSDGATITMNAVNGFEGRVVLGGNRTLSITNPQEGQFFTVKIVQDGTGNRTLTLPGGSSAALNFAAGDSTILVGNFANSGWTWSSGARLTGTGTLTAGTVTISTVAISSTSKVFLTYTSCSNCGTLYVGTITGGSSFVVSSNNALDASTFNYLITQ